MKKKKNKTVSGGAVKTVQNIVITQYQSVKYTTLK